MISDTPTLEAPRPSAPGEPRIHYPIETQGETTSKPAALIRRPSLWTWQRDLPKDDMPDEWTTRVFAVTAIQSTASSAAVLLSTTAQQRTAAWHALWNSLREAREAKPHSLKERLYAAGLIRSLRTRASDRRASDAEFASWSELLSRGRSVTDLIREDRDAL